jgi:hypothetical protein
MSSGKPFRNRSSQVNPKTGSRLKQHPRWPHPCPVASYPVSMPELDQSVSTKTPGSFASLLASISSKLQAGAWDDSALVDDVASITYEQALRAHRRGRPPEPATRLLLDDAAQTPAPSATRSRKQPQKTGEKKPKAASITIRVTAEEQVQLHERAAAAELSVSAYLRSCIFEAETLRNQVREAVFQIRSATPPDVPASDAAPDELRRKHSRSWRARLLPLWHRRRASA